MFLFGRDEVRQERQSNREIGDATGKLDQFSVAHADRVWLFLNP